MDIRKYSIPSSESVLNAMKKIDETGRRILFVVDIGFLKGVITDGDIRRYILKSGDLNRPVDQMMNRKPVTLFDHEIDRCKAIFESSIITGIPIIDQEGRLVNIMFWEHVFKEKRKRRKGELTAPVVMMAGGKGSRLYPYTRVLPKPLIPIGDTPIVERIINRFYRFGATDFYMTVNYKKNMIKAYFNELNHPYSLKFVDEDKPLGTGGSLALMKDVLKETFFLSNCDILVDGDYYDMYDYHRKKGNAITMISSVKNFVIPYGVIELNSKELVDRINEKPEQNVLINTGVYIVEPEVIDYIPINSFYHFTDLIDACIAKGEKVGIYPISEKSWMDMGQVSELEEMQKRLEVYE